MLFHFYNPLKDDYVSSSHLTICSFLTFVCPSYFQHHAIKTIDRAEPTAIPDTLSEQRLLTFVALLSNIIVVFYFLLEM